jgi:hypothetical protein
LRWLASQGRAADCKSILAKIAKTNGKSPSKEFYENFELTVQKEKEEAAKLAKVTFWDLFRTPQLRKNTILMVVAM